MREWKLTKLDVLLYSLEKVVCWKDLLDNFFASIRNMFDNPQHFLYGHKDPEDISRNQSHLWSQTIT